MSTTQTTAIRTGDTVIVRFPNGGTYMFGGERAAVAEVVMILNYVGDGVTGKLGQQWRKLHYHKHASAAVARQRKIQKQTGKLLPASIEIIHIEDAA